MVKRIVLSDVESSGVTNYFPPQPNSVLGIGPLCVPYILYRGLEEYTGKPVNFSLISSPIPKGSKVTLEVDTCPTTLGFVETPDEECYIISANYRKPTQM